MERVAALYCDLDVKPGGLQSFDACMDVIAAVSAELGGRQPVAIVSTGHGLQPYWRLDGGEDVARAQCLLRRFGVLVAVIAAEHGGAVDNVFDAARVLRLPGTINVKFPDDPKPVGVQFYDDDNPDAEPDSIDLDELDVRLTEAGIRDVPEDGDGTGEAVPLASWPEGSTCPYVSKMLAGLPTDGPRTVSGANPSRHHWALNKAVRLYAARRLGCLSDDDLAAGLELVRLRLLQLLGSGEKRSLAPYEWAGILRWARRRVESFTPERLALELPHAHAGASGSASVGVSTTPAPGPDDDHTAPLFADVAAFLAGGGPIAPLRVAGRRTDGEDLFYAGQVNVLFGDPESGKTWLALHAGAEALRSGQSFAMLDMDHNSLGGVVERLRMLGVSDELLTDPGMFRYAEPEDAANLDAVVAALVEWAPAVVVVDSVGELLPLLGLNSNSPDDFTLAHTRALKPLARAGSCVVIVDHLAKNPDSRKAGPTGTTAKRRAVGGVSLRVHALEKFTPGVGGKAAITINKDRHGGLRAVCPTSSAEPHAGTFVMDAAGSCFIAAPGQTTDPNGSSVVGLIEMSERVMAVVRLLDDLEVPNSCGRDKARAALAEAGWPASNGDVAAAVKLRKHRAQAA